MLLACPPAANAPCVDDGDCQRTQLCRDGQCRSACNSDLDCSRREQCIDGACLPATVSNASSSGDRARLDASARDVSSSDVAMGDAVATDSATSDALAANHGGGDHPLLADAWHRDSRGGEGALGDASGSDRPPPVDASSLDGAVGVDFALASDASLGWDLGLHRDRAIVDQGSGLDAASGGDGGPDASVATCPGAPFPLLCPAEDSTLRACYTFDDDVPIPDSGIITVPDHSAHGNHGQGRGIGHEAGVHGLAALFAGAQLVSVADDASLDFIDQVTVEAWVYPTAYPAAGARMGVVDNNAEYAIFLRSGGVPAPGPRARWPWLTCADP